MLHAQTLFSIIFLLYGEFTCHVVFMGGGVRVVDSLQSLPLRHKFQKNLERPPQNLNKAQPCVISIRIPYDTCESDVQKRVDEHLMDMALKQAREAGEKYGEVPIGALVAQPIQRNGHSPKRDESDIVIKVSILSYGQNQIEKKYDASAHAELQSLRTAAKRIQNWRLLNCTLYSTLEPCPMCLSAAQAFRVKRIVYGAPDLRLGAVETYISLLDYPHPFHGSDSMEVIGGVRSKEAKELLVGFFRERRKEAKSKKKSFAVETKEIAGEAALQAQKVQPKSFLRRLLSKIRRRIH